MSSSSPTFSGLASLCIGCDLNVSGFDFEENGSNPYLDNHECTLHENISKQELSGDIPVPVSTPEIKPKIENFECREYIDIDSIEEAHITSTCKEIISTLFGSFYGVEKTSLTVESSYREAAINELLHQMAIEFRNGLYYLTISKRIEQLLKKHFRLTLEKILENGLFGSAEKVLYALNESIKNGLVKKTIRNEYELIEKNDYDDEIGEVKDYDINQDFEELKEHMAQVNKKQLKLIDMFLRNIVTKKKTSLRFKKPK